MRSVLSFGQGGGLNFFTDSTVFNEEKFDYSDSPFHGLPSV